MVINTVKQGLLAAVVIGFTTLVSVGARSAEDSSDTPFISFADRFHPIVSRRGMVVSQERLASEIGAQILGAGGNAVDAAVATGFALAVTLPQAGNLGGGGFMLVHLADEQRTIAIDYRETAPLAATVDMFLGPNGEADPKKSRYGYQSAGIPGTVAGLIHALDRYGSLPLETVLMPAVRLAEEGFTVTVPLAFSLQRAASRLSASPASKKYYFNAEGETLATGSLWRQPDLAKTLRVIAREGSDGFYKGAVAELIIRAMEKNAGLITRKDLEDYRVVERAPVVGRYRNHEIHAMPPPSSGGVHLVQMLNMLEGWDLSGLGHNSAAYLHRLVESMRRAYADRSKYLGDPDFTPVPVAALTSKTYAKQLRERVDLKRATPSERVLPGAVLGAESHDTTHFSVWDAAGNVVSNTYTINFSYGSGIAVDGAGFLLNNEMDDFVAKPGTPNAYGLVGGAANAIAPRKRPLSSMTPVIVLESGRPVMTTGSPGGSTIITTVLQTLLNVIDFEMNIAEAAAAPRIHHQWLPDKVFMEEGISPDTQQLLRGMGHNLQLSPRVLGRTQSISSDGRNTYGANDYRWPGGAAVAELPAKRGRQNKNK